MYTLAGWAEEEKERIQDLYNMYTKRINSEHPGTAEAAEKVAKAFRMKELGVDKARQLMAAIFVPKSADDVGVEDFSTNDLNDRYSSMIDFDKLSTFTKEIPMEIVKVRKIKNPSMVAPLKTFLEYDGGKDDTTTKTTTDR